MEGLKSKKPMRNVLGRGLSALISTPVAVHTPDSLARVVTPRRIDTTPSDENTERA